MAGQPVVSLPRETNWSVLQSPGTEPFNLLELFLVDGLEVAGNSAITLGGTLHGHC